jgi:transcriptional regulator with XRE-family HTH domain
LKRSVPQNTEEDIHDLASRIFLARIGSDLSQRELARKSGVDHVWISRLESGERCNPSAKTMKALAITLSV